jgi:hypothetical protein
MIVAPLADARPDRIVGVDGRRLVDGIMLVPRADWDRRSTSSERNARVLSVLGTSELSPTPAAVRPLVSLDPPAAMTPEGEDALLWAISTEDDGAGWDALTPGRTPRQRQIPLHDEGMLAACRAARSGHYNLVTDVFTHDSITYDMSPPSSTNTRIS